MKDGERVVSYGEGRKVLASPLVVTTGDDEHPYQWQAREITTKRTFTVTLLLLAGCVLGGSSVATLFDTTAAQLLAICTVAVLVAGGVILSLVDIDAYLLDFPTFFVWLGATWVLTLVTLGVGGEFGRLKGGLGAVGVLVLYEAVSYIYKRFRGLVQGLGDTLIAIVSSGVPSVLTGAWETGLHSAIAAGLIVIVWFLVQAARGKVQRETPIPLGPFLIAGAVASLVIAALGGV
jgi:prepilin signal peptidase PulO-like enzyme (type II secretory pathway)